MEADRLRRLLDAGQEVVARLELEALLDHLLRTARELTGARYAALGVLDEQRTALARFVWDGLDDETARRIGHVPRGRGVLGALVTEPAALRLADVSDDPRSSGFPANHPPMRTFLGVPILIREEAWGNLYLTEKAGGEEFTEEDEEAAVTLAAWAAVAVENARLYEGVERRRTELERAVRGLEATTAIARAVGAESLDRVLGLIASRGQALAQARGVEIALRERDGLRVAATAGEAGGAEASLVIALAFRGRDLGELRVHGGTPDPQLLDAFAASAATAVASAQSVERERLRHAMQAAEEERKRWARELHDETLQGLGALRMGLSAAAREPDPERLRELVSGSLDQIAAEIQNLRAIITDLRPAALDQLGLRPALESLIERVRAVEGLECEARLELPGALAPEVETTIYRLVQEALTNVARHAGATRVTVAVVAEGGAVRLAVADDGRGFDPDAPAAGFGLRGMRERVQLAGGTLDLATGETGTRLSAVVPV